MSAIPAKFFTGWDSASITNVDLGLTVNLPHLATEVSAFTEENIAVDATSTQIYGGRRVTLVLGFFGDTEYATLKDWEATYANCTFRAEGRQRLVWDAQTTIEVVKMPKADKRNGLNIYQLTAEVMGEDPRADIAFQGIGVMIIGSTFRIS